MTIAQALAVNTLLRWILGRKDIGADRKVTDDDALKAAIVLCEKANKALSAGLRPQDVEQLWPGSRPRAR